MQQQDIGSSIASDKTWKKYRHIGDWVKNIPNLLQTLKTSKSEEDLTVARKSLIFNFCSVFERLKSVGENTKLLCDLLATVNNSVFEILVSDALQKGSLLSEMIDLTHLVTDGRKNEMDWTTPLYRLSDSTYKHLDEIIDQIDKKDDPKFIQGCCYLMSSLKVHSTDSDNIILETLTEISEKYDDDQTRACALLALYKKENRMAADNIKLHALTTEKFLATPDPSLAKLAASIFIASRRFTKSSQAVATALADYIKFQKYYDQIWSSIPFKHHSLINIISKVVPKLTPVIDWFMDQAIIHLQHLDAHEESMTTLIRGVDLFLEVTLNGQIEPGMKVTELQPFVVRSLEQLVEMNKIWSIEGIEKKLSTYGLSCNQRASLQEFLANKSTSEIKNYPTFAGLDKVDWSELQDAYGPAIQVPDAIRKLASRNHDTQNDGLSIIYSNVVHQGSLFPGKIPVWMGSLTDRELVAPHVVPFLMEILDCSSTINPALLRLIRSMLYFNPEEFLYKKEYYDVNEMYPNPGQDEFAGYVHQIHTFVKKDIHIIFKLLLGDDLHCVSEACKILPLLDKAVDLGAVPVLKQAIEKNSDWSTKGEMLWSLSYLYPRIAPRDECLEYFLDQWKQFKANGVSPLSIVAGLARVYLHYCEATPKFLVDALLDDESTDTIYLLGMIKSELAFPALLQRFKHLETHHIDKFMLVRVLVDTAFKFEIDFGKPIIGSALKPNQLELLQAMIDCPNRVIDVVESYLMHQRLLPQNIQGLKRLVEEAEASREIENDM